jgi:hypothetical protein
VSLVQRARIEAYIPVSPDPAYRDALDWLILEFSYSFGGCTVINNCPIGASPHLSLCS